MNWTVKGHDWAVQMLQQHIERGGVRHAYLFTGSPGVGRRTLALQFARALNCQAAGPASGQPTGAICGTCRACTQIARMQHPDLSIVQPEPDSRSIKVEQIRDLQYTLNLSPYEARYRVALLTDFQAATQGAQNAFLKTLEEAPKKVILLLTADLAENLLPTIVSRCEIFRLRPSAPPAVQALLQAEYGLEEAAARQVAHLAGGKVGTAIAYHQDPARLEAVERMVEETLRMGAMNTRERFKLVDRWRSSKRDREESVRLRLEVLETLQGWLLFWRDVYLAQLNADVPRTYLRWEAEIDRLAGRVGMEESQALIAALEQALHRLESTNVNMHLLVEALLLDWPRV